MLNGCLVAKGEYIKALSPGDCLYEETTLCKWAEFVKTEGTDICFGDPVHYVPYDDRLEVISLCSMPRIKKIYNKQQIREQKINFVLLEDNANGASFLVKRELFVAYLKKIHNKIIFAEDLAYRLMVLDDIPIIYYPEVVLWYESGTGISWSKDFSLKIIKDVKKSKEIILDEDYPPDSFARKYQSFLIRISDIENKTLMRLIRIGYFPKVLYWEEYRKINKLSTPIRDNSDFMKNISGGMSVELNISEEITK